ncbi:hypothetical protein VTN00DRAFT_9153 [Thermoascus crustaceus]|uniref:uncharacterized protein n=1 Tax=Thermoascus crustaceus TaxID=5088 RepID=UPI0037448565
MAAFDAVTGLLRRTSNDTAEGYGFRRQQAELPCLVCGAGETFPMESSVPTSTLFLQHPYDSIAKCQGIMKGRSRARVWPAREVMAGCGPRGSLSRDADASRGFSKWLEVRRGAAKMRALVDAQRRPPYIIAGQTALCDFSPPVLPIINTLTLL